MRPDIILADDLTGTCDAALQYYKHGYAATVLLQVELFDQITADVIALNSDSRACSAGDARERVSRTLSQLPARGIRSVYKKVDSTLRGNVGSELDAMIDILQAEVILLAPSFPAQGRTVEQGHMLVGGQHVAATPFADGLPLSSSLVTALVAYGSKWPTATIDISIVRKGMNALEQAIKDVVTDGIRILAVDASDDVDLATIAALLFSNSEWVGAGSAGLAGALAASCMLDSRRTTSPQKMRPGSGPILTVVGSRHPLSRTQLKQLSNVVGVDTVLINPKNMTDDQESKTVAQVAAQVSSSLESGRDTVLTTELATQPDEDDLSRSHTIATALGQIMARVAGLVGGLVLTGGDTALAALRELEVYAADIVAEVATGIPALVLRGGRCPGMPIITKAGGFGTAHSLLVANQFLKEKMA